MKAQLILFFVALGLTVAAQQETETYFKDYFLTKEVPEKKAKYKKVETTTSDGTINIKIFNLPKECLLKEENYKDSKPIGQWITYSQTCTLVAKRDFSKLVYSNKQIDSLFNNVIEDGNPENYEKAQFGDDKNAIFKYLASTVRYPTEAKDAGLSGKVFLQLIIKSDGKVEMVSIVRGAHPFLDYESWEVIENMPNWNPAKKNGVPIDSYYNLPIKFTLR